MLSFSAALFGLVLGARHALEPDHLAAVSALSPERRSVGARIALGASWGLGHTLMLVLVGGGLVLFEAKMPERVSLFLELAVGVMIIVLGLDAVRRALTEGRAGKSHPHHHGAFAHEHAAPHAHLHLKRWTLATRPLLVGAMHGLAGSGALTAMVLVELHGWGSRLGYLALFGFGSVAGMAVLSALAGWPLQKLRESKRLSTAAGATVGSVSAAFGVFWVVSAALALLGR